MKRYLFNLIAGLSLILGLATAAMWVRSHFYCDHSSWVRDGETRFYSYTDRGIAAIAVGREWSDLVVEDGWGYWTDPIQPAAPHDPPTEMLAFRHEVYSGGLGGSDRWIVKFPLALAFIVSGLTPMLWIIRFHRVRRQQLRGCCHHCGYDLRATPGRCPECGTLPESTG